jgi:hypothetical protein
METSELRVLCEIRTLRGYYHSAAILESQFPAELGDAIQEGASA